MYEDKTLVCKECGQEFVFTAGEQEFYAERGFQNEPQRCKACRDARKAASRGPREYFTATCAACGGEAKVPFEPKSDRPVYCSDCFARMREQGSQPEERKGRPHGRPFFASFSDRLPNGRGFGFGCIPCGLRFKWGETCSHGGGKEHRGITDRFDAAARGPSRKLALQGKQEN